MTHRLSYDDKITYTFFSIKKLLKQNILIPNCQRELYPERVDKFKDIMNEAKFIFINPFILCRFNTNLYIIDGNHRYSGLKQCNDQGIKKMKDNDITIPICIIDCQTLEEVNLHYHNINDQFSLIQPSLESDKNSYNKWSKWISNKLYKKFPKYFSKSVRCKRPNMNRNRLEENIIAYLEMKNINSKEFLYSRIILLNEKLAKTHNINPKILDKIYNKKGENCYLGAYGNYIWFNKINLKPIPIPRVVRDTTLTTYSNGKCYCCENEPITKRNYHCGHIISDNYGGKITSHNLRPICSYCNTSMGNSFMFDYMKKKGYNNEKVNRIENEYKTNPHLFQYI